MKIGIVGVCASGKSTLISQLSEAGYDPKHIAQEHSYVPDMWKKITNPDVLIFLEASYHTTLLRRKFNWTYDDWVEQVFRLRHARENANLIIQTDELTPHQIFLIVKEFLSNLS